MKKNSKLGREASVITKAYQVLHALNHDGRQHIINLIRNKGEMSTKEVAMKTRTDPAQASTQVRMLAIVGVLTPRRDGKYMFYSLNSPRLSAIAKATEILNNYEIDELKSAT